MSEELAIQEGGKLVIPDFLKGETGGEGFDRMSQEDLVIPRLCLTQGLTREKKRSHPNYVEGLKDGDFFNSVTGVIYGGLESPVQVIPLQFTKSRIYFKDLDEGGGVLCRSMNAVDGGSLSKTCAVCEHGVPFQGACTLFKNYLSLLLPQRELIVVSFKMTGLKVANQWGTRMKMLGGNKPMFSAVYDIRSVEAKNAKGEFYLPAISLKRFVTEDEFKFAKETFVTLSGRNVVMHEDGLDTPEAEAPKADDKVPF